MALSAPPPPKGIPEGSPPTTLMARGTPIALSTPPISIPVESLPPNVMATVDKGIICAAAGQQHPG